MNYSQGFVDYLTEASGSPYQACLVTKRKLEENGYKELKENQIWELKQNEKYFLTRDNSSIIAFRTNKSNETGRFIISGSHLDSPYLKIKPKPSSTAFDVGMIHCEVYGGGIWNTWVDRDLGISGRVILQDGKQMVFSIKEPLMRISGLAIHLDTKRDYLINKETSLPAMFCQTIYNKSDHVKILYEIIAKHLNIDQNEIIAHDIMLCDIQPAAFISNKKYIVGQGIDNLNGVYTSLIAFLNSEENNKEFNQIDVFVGFDHEEIGSTTRRGGNSCFLPNILERIHSSLFVDANPQSIFISFAKSLILSVDGAHATHPNIDLTEKNHPIRLNGGPVLKQHCAQKYMSDGLLRSLIKQAANDVPTQVFILRQDLLGGSTIGPLIASRSGITTIDMGNAMLSMHSIREMCGADDVDHMINLIQKCYTSFPEIPN